MTTNTPPDIRVAEAGRARTAWLITGVPGAGKTTVARALAATLPRAAHIGGDVLGGCIVSGAVWPGQEPESEARRQQHLVVHGQCLLARAFADAGFVPVMEYVVVERARLGRYRRALAGLDLRFVVLDPDREVVLRRDRDRPEKTVAERFVHLRDPMVRELAGTGLWVDSSALSVAETVALVLQEQHRASVR